MQKERPAIGRTLFLHLTDTILYSTVFYLPSRCTTSFQEKVQRLFKEGLEYTT